jgi:hypothetical protein
MICSAYSAFILSRLDRAVKFRNLFILYNISVFLLFLNTDIIYSIYGDTFDERKLNREIELLNLAFSIVEMHVFFTVLKSFLHGAKLNRYISRTFYVTAGVLIVMYFKLVQLDIYSESNQIAEYSALVHFLPVIPFITFYFYTLYKDNLILDKDFTLIIFSMFSYCIISTIVFSISCVFIDQYVRFRLLYTLHYFFLILLLLAILSFGLKEKKLGHLRP